MRMLCLIVVLALAGVGRAEEGEKAPEQAPVTTRKIVSEDGKPQTVTNVVDWQGAKFATIVMTGKEMVIDEYGRLLSGAGFVESVKDKTFFVNFTGKNGRFGLHIEKIEWDESGRPVAARGAKKLETQKGDVAVVDGNAPRVADGIIYLKLASHGDKEYAFRTSFNKGVSVEPEDFN